MKRALNIQGCFRKCPHPMRLKLERMWLFPHPLHPRTPACMTVHGEFSRCDWQCIKSPGHDIVTNSYFDCFYPNIFLQVEPMQHYRICKENPRWSNHSYKFFFHCCLCWICFLSEYGFFFLKRIVLGSCYPLFLQNVCYLAKDTHRCTYISEKYLVHS